MKAVREWLNADVTAGLKEWLFYAAFLIVGIVAGILLHA